MRDTARLLVAFLLLAPAAASATDTDTDGYDDSVDNCTLVANTSQCDTDEDGFGNACDGDFNQNGVVGITPSGDPDYQTFQADFASGVDSGVGTDMDCNGSVTSGDFDEFSAQQSQGTPGPSALLCAGFAPCLDPDHDGVASVADNCTGVPNASQCDTDEDGYGNHCDGDFDQNERVNSNDFSQYFTPDFQSGTDSGVGTDMDCNGSVNSNDYTQRFVPSFTLGVPGPSGLGCAGTEPCAPETTQQTFFAQDFSSKVQAVADSQGRIHGVYVRTASGQRRYLEYVTQTSPTAALTSQTVVDLTSPNDGIDPSLVDIALNSEDHPCLVWAKRDTTNNASTLYSFYGCLGESGFEFEEISNVLGRSSGDAQLVLTSTGVPHISFYQHVDFLGSGPNHSAWHVWYDGDSWERELIPLPTAYQSPFNALSEGVCTAVDANDRVYFAFGVAYDFGDDLASNIPPPADYQGALALAVKHPTNGWESSTVIRAEAGGVDGTRDLARACDLEIVNGVLHLPYRLDVESTGSEVVYARGTASGWTFTDVAAGPRASKVAIDAEENAYFALDFGHPEIELVRADASGTLLTRTLGAWFSVGSSVIATSSGGSTTCRVLHTRRETFTDHRVVLTRIEGCEE